MVHTGNYLEKLSLVFIGLCFLCQIGWLIAEKRLLKQQFNSLNITKLKKYFFSLVFVLAVVFIFSFEVKEVFVSYFAWKMNPLSRLLLPPYQPITYFLISTSSKLIFPYLISLFFSLVFLFLASFLNKKSSESYFYPEEPIILSLAIFLSGYPGFLIYLILFFAIFFIFNLILTTINLFKEKKLEKISPYFLWLPVAFFAIILINWLSQSGYLIWFNL